MSLTNWSQSGSQLVWSQQLIVATTNTNGFYEAQLFQGDYKVRLNHTTADSSLVQSLVIDSESQQDIVFLSNAWAWELKFFQILPINLRQLMVLIFLQGKHI